VGLVQDFAELGGRPQGLRRVPGLCEVFPVPQVCCEVRLPLDVDVNSPLGGEPSQGGKIGALPGLVGRLIEFASKGGKRGGGDLCDGLAQGGAVTVAGG
jgi:hypothetical protein